MDRRRFIKLCSGAAAGLSLPHCGSGSDGETNIQTPGIWGAPQGDQLAAMLSPDRVPERVLEVFVGGGMNPWDTFYVVPEHGDPKRGGPHAKTQWWCFQDDGYMGIPEVFGRCGGGSRALYEPFGTDAAGRTVNLGPWIYPLRDRPDILARMRVLVMHHDVLPHHAALPLGLSGIERSSPRMAVLGSHLQRYHRDRETGDHPAPYSYLIMQSSLDINGNADAAAAVGLHRGSARPMSVRLGSGDRLTKQLLRTAVSGHRDQTDRLVRHWLSRWEDRLRLRGEGAPARSAELADMAAARTSMENHEALVKLLDANVMTIGGDATCGDVTVPDETEAGLRLAAHLLTTQEQPARYVNLIDGGLYPDPAGLGYDTHWDHVGWSSRNLVHLSRRLAAIINEPGEGDPRKLDLDKHMVVLNTEFGRTPYREVSQANPAGTGTNHWAAGYVVVMIGGLVDETRRGVIGAINEGGAATEGFTPAEFRAGVLLGLGVWPFSAEGFRVSDVRGAKNELEAAMILREKVLGYPS